MKKIGLFGGTFNPIHNGHLYIAEQFLQQCQLDSVIFLPAGDPYHKHTDLASPEHRLAMIEAAIAYQPQFAVSDCDLVRVGATYSIDTIHIFRQHFPSAQLYWLMGMDSLLNLYTWRNWQSFVKQCKIAVASRSGSVLANAPRELRDWISEALPSGNLLILQTQNQDIQSSHIRQAIAEGQNPRAWLPESVANYMENHQLYQTNGTKHA